MFKSITKLGAAMLLSISITNIHSQQKQWTDLREGQISNAQPGIYQNLAFNKFGVAYIAFQYKHTVNTPTNTIVKKWNGDTWQAVGGATGFGPTGVVEQKLVINSESNNPIVSFVNENVGYSQVLSFNGISWSAVGSTILGYGTVLALSPNNVPYIAFNNTFNNIVVQSFSGSNWMSVGTITGPIPALSRFTLVFSPSGVPFVSYTDNATTKINVVSFSGTSWNIVGNPNLSAGNNDYQSLAFNANGIPYIAYQDAANGNRTTVQSLSGSNWGLVGMAGFGTVSGIGIASYQSLAFDNMNVPHVAFSRDGACTILRFNGTTWLNMNGSNANQSSVASQGANNFYQSLKFNPITNEPWVAFNAPDMYFGTVVRYGIHCLEPTNAPAPPSIIIDPFSQTSCQQLNETVTFSVTGAGHGLTYEWSNGSQGRVMTTSVLGNNYRVTISGTCGKITSNVATHTAKTPTTIATQPESVTLCGGTLGYFTVMAAPTNIPIDYTWNTGLRGTNQLATTTPGMYNVTLASSCGTAVSNFVSLTNKYTTIDTEPTSQTICKGSSATFALTASGENLTYQWQNNSSTNSEATYTLAGFYLATVSGTCGKVVSIPFNLQTKETSISAHPQSQSICKGSKATFDVIAIGDNLAYVWSNGLSTTTSMVSSTLGTNYNVTVIGTCGNAISNAFNITSISGPSIVSQPISKTACVGANATYSVSAIGSNLNYTWSNNLSNTNSMTTSVAGLNYVVTVTGTCGLSVVSSPFAYISTVCSAAISSVSIVFLSTLPSTFTGTKANITWPTLLGANTYCIRYSKTANFSTVVKTVCGLTAANYLFVLSAAGLRTEATNETIYYEVAGVDANGDMSQWSDVQSFELREAETTSTNLPTYQSTNLTMYPNPTKGKFSVLTQLSTTNSELLTIFNAQGSVVYSQKIVSENTQINANLIKGIYLVKVGNVSKKLVVE